VFGQTQVDSQADEVLKAVTAYNSRLSSLVISAEITEESVYGDTHKLQFGGTLDIGIRRPASFFAVVQSDLENRRMYLSDGTFTVFDEDVNVYAQAPVPGNLLLVGNASSVIYVGVGNVNGRDCHHIAGILDDMDWQLWVRKGGDPELCKYVVTDRDVPMAPQFSITITKWAANAAISDRQFRFQAPADAEAIEFVK
jgi:hypothetical protein